MPPDSRDELERLALSRRQLDSPDLMTRWRGLRGLAEMGAPEAVDKIISAIRDGDEMSAANAANLVRRTHLRAAIPAIIDRLSHLEPDANDTNVCLMIYALASLPDERSLPLLAQLVISPSRKIRRAGAGGLGAIGNPAAYDAIAKASAALPFVPALALRATFKLWVWRPR
jgi:HEAT repeat protein